MKKIQIVKKTVTHPKYEKDGIDNNSQWIEVDTWEETVYVLCVDGKELPGEEWVDLEYAELSLKNNWTKQGVRRYRNRAIKQCKETIESTIKELKRELKDVKKRMKLIDKYLGKRAN